MHKRVSVAATGTAAPRVLKKPLRLVLTVVAVASMLLSLGAGTAGAATASRDHQPTCRSGNIASGVYDGLTITGMCTVPSGATVVVHGNLVVTSGAYLNAFTMGVVVVTGNVWVGPKAVLALGCTLNSEPPPTPCTGTTPDVVGGNIAADRAMTMFLDGLTVLGNVTSRGGGPGLTLNPYVNFPIKDNVIYGNVTVTGWHGAWFGYIRNVSFGNVLLRGIVGLTVSPMTHLPDSNEVVSDLVAGNLACYGNVPAPQVGDSGGAPNVIGGRALGQCAHL